MNSSSSLSCHVGSQKRKTHCFSLRHRKKRVAKKNVITKDGVNRIPTRCGNLVKTNKKKHMEHFFPQIQVKTKKKVFSKNRTLFSPNLHAQMYTHSNYWGDADVDHSQTIEWDTAKVLGGYIPPSPLISAPLISAQQNIQTFEIIPLSKVKVAIS